MQLVLLQSGGSSYLTTISSSSGSSVWKVPLNRISRKSLDFPKFPVRRKLFFPRNSVGQSSNFLRSSLKGPCKKPAKQTFSAQLGNQENISYRFSAREDARFFVDFARRLRRKTRSSRNQQDHGRNWN